MSNHPIVEWSPEACLVVEPGSHAISSHVSPTDALAAIGKPKRIVLSLGLRQVFVKSVRLPNVPVEEARNLVRFRLEDIFPIPAAEAAYDLISTDDVNGEGREFIIIATKGDTLRQAKSLFNHAGAKIDQIVLAGLGSIQIADSALSSIVISPCAEGLAFDAIDNGNLIYSRVAPVASTKVEIESELTRAIAASGLSNPIVIAHSSLNELVSPNVRLTDDHPLSNLSHHLPNINLRLPEDMAKVQSAKLASRKRVAALLFLAFGVAIANAWMLRDEDAKNAKKVADQYKTRIEGHETITSRNTLEISKLNAQNTMVEDGVEPRQALGDVVTIVANAAPQGLWLTGLNLERGKDLSVRGTALSNAQVGAFNEALSATPRLKDVKLVFSNNNAIGEVPVVQFSISAHVVGNLPLADPKKETRRR